MTTNDFLSITQKLTTSIMKSSVDFWGWKDDGIGSWGERISMEFRRISSALQQYSKNDQISLAFSRNSSSKVSTDDTLINRARLKKGRGVVKQNTHPKSRIFCFKEKSQSGNFPSPFIFFTSRFTRQKESSLMMMKR